MSTLLLYTLRCCVSEVVSTEVPMEKNVPRLKLFPSSSNITCKRTQKPLASSFSNAQWLRPCVCITSHLVSGFSRRKSKIKSLCTEHLSMYTFTIFAHIQRAIINQPECSRGFNVETFGTGLGFGLQSSFVWDALQWCLLQILERPKKNTKKTNKVDFL